MAGIMTMVCGCVKGMADEQIYKEVMKKAEVYQQETVYIKGLEGLIFLWRRAAQRYWGCGESRTKREMDRKMLDAVLGENGEKKEKSQKNEKN